MSAWTPSSIAAATGGEWLTPPGTSDAPVSGVSTDTRTIRPGEAFFALRGERFDAHDRLADALRAGAAVLIVDDRRKCEHAVSSTQPGGTGVPPASARPLPLVPILLVPDARRALGRLAAAHRASLGATRVIAVLGANGKTTTTRLIDSVLRTRLRGSASPKSFNNDIGVPLTILGATPGDEYLVCEVGTNHPGEIAALAPIVAPDLAVITSVGRAHIEHFGTLRAIVEEDAAIFGSLRPGGAAIVPAGEPLIEACVRGVEHVVRFGTAPDADVRVTGVTPDEDGAGLRFTIRGAPEFRLPLVGEHNALNAAAAIAVARRLGLDDRAIAEGLAAATPADMRLNRREIRGVRFLIDCYNANPESAAAALRAFAGWAKPARRRVVVLGDMLELGAHAEAAHREVGGVLARECPCDLFITVGRLAAHAADAVRERAGSATLSILDVNDESWPLAAAAQLRPGDAVLLKASRGTRLERLVEAFG